MSVVVDFYQQQALQQASSLPWLRQMQNHALVDFMKLGFPTRKQEDWKYSAPDAFLQSHFLTALEEKEEQVGSAFADLPLSCRLNVWNGKSLRPSFQASLPAGVIIQPLAQAFLEHADKMKPYLNQILPQEHGFQLLNTALLQQGFFIYLPENTVLETPILLSHWQDKENHAAHLRHIIVVGKGSSVELIEEFNGSADVCYFSNVMTEVHLAERAKLKHYKIQCESRQAYHVGHVAVQQSAHSDFASHVFSLGGKWVRSDLSIDLQEEHANCMMNGVYALKNEQHMDHHTLVHHRAARCHSEQEYRGILNGQSHGVFNGRVIVAKGAAQSQAKQQNKNLLLSAKTEMDTKPQLEIFADDVICTHGATVGQLDEDALFYLATRGINRKNAMEFLIRAFVEVNLQHLASPQLAQCLIPLLSLGG